MIDTKRTTVLRLSSTDWIKNKTQYVQHTYLAYNDGVTSGHVANILEGDLKSIQENILEDPIESPLLPVILFELKDRGWMLVKISELESHIYTKDTHPCPESSPSPTSTG